MSSSSRDERLSKNERFSGEERLSRNQLSDLPQSLIIRESRTVSHKDEQGGEENDDIRQETLPYQQLPPQKVHISYNHA